MSDPLAMYLHDDLAGAAVAIGRRVQRVQGVDAAMVSETPRSSVTTSKIKVVAPVVSNDAINENLATERLGLCE
jgi:hypothetical protein